MCIVHIFEKLNQYTVCIKRKGRGTSEILKLWANYGTYLKYLPITRIPGKKRSCRDPSINVHVYVYFSSLTSWDLWYFKMAKGVFI